MNPFTSNFFLTEVLSIIILITLMAILGLNYPIALDVLVNYMAIRKITLELYLLLHLLFQNLITLNMFNFQ